MTDDGGANQQAQRRALILIATSQLLALALWFSASAVGAELEEVWGLTMGQTAGLTLAVQIGFVVGAFGSAVLGLADALASRRFFVIAALIGAATNAALVLLGPGDHLVAFVLRLLTGMALAGVYPSGLKVMAGWFRQGRGMALGLLVGALTVGSAGPHLIRGFGFDWKGVVLIASALAVTAAAVMWIGVEDGPFEVPSSRFSGKQLGRVVKNQGVRLSTYGYLGHMWELYAMWTWTAAGSRHHFCGYCGRGRRRLVGQHLCRPLWAGIGGGWIHGDFRSVCSDHPIRFWQVGCSGCPGIPRLGLQRGCRLGPVFGHGHRNIRGRGAWNGTHVADCSRIPLDPGDNPGSALVGRDLVLAMGLPDPGIGPSVGGRGDGALPPHGG
jgi:hypothetical protein